MEMKIKVFVTSDDAKLFNIVKNEFNDAIVEYDTFRKKSTWNACL